MAQAASWRLYGGAAVLVGLALLLAYQFVAPEPPDRVVIAGGPVDGAYTPHAERYRELLGKEGIELEIRSTAGSIANLALLADPASGVQAAIVQGGLGDALPADAGLLSLGGLFLEPLWAFTRLDPAPDRLNELRGARLAIGPEGSGTRALVLRLLELNGVDAQNTTLLPLGGADAAAALAEGKADVAFFVSAFGAPIIRRLATATDIELMGFSRAPGYAQVFRTVEEVVLHAGVLDFGQDRPPTDRPLIAATANLVVRGDLHPALMDLLLIAAREAHEPGDIFTPAGRFPSPHAISFPLAAQAQRFYERGPPFLLRFMPFWAATFIDRTSVMLIPLLTLLLPLLRILPPLVTWRMQSRVYRWYGRLAEIEDRVSSGDPAAVAKARADLVQVDHEISKISVPESYQYLVYRLRSHLDVVKTRLDETAVHISRATPRSGPSPGEPALTPRPST